MQIQYLALLRGINVGGNALIKMADLQQALAENGFTDVKTYIQTGNVFFTSPDTDKQKLAQSIRAVITSRFSLNVDTVVFNHEGWAKIIESAPAWWGHKPEWKHNLLVFLTPVPKEEALAAIGTLKPDIEAVEAGPGVLYQGLSLELFGRTTSGKLASSPLYKKLTIRNYNTSTKLLALFAS